MHDDHETCISIKSEQVLDTSDLRLSEKYCHYQTTAAKNSPVTLDSKANCNNPTKKPNSGNRNSSKSSVFARGVVSTNAIVFFPNTSTDLLQYPNLVQLRTSFPLLLTPPDKVLNVSVSSGYQVLNSLDVRNQGLDSNGWYQVLDRVNILGSNGIFDPVGGVGNSAAFGNSFKGGLDFVDDGVGDITQGGGVLGDCGGGHIGGFVGCGREQREYAYARVEGNTMVGSQCSVCYWCMGMRWVIPWYSITAFAGDVVGDVGSSNWTRGDEGRVLKAIAKSSVSGSREPYNRNTSLIEPRVLVGDTNMKRRIQHMLWTVGSYLLGINQL